MEEKDKFDIENEDDLEETEIVTLYDEIKGEEIDCEQIYSLIHNDKLYVVLTPVDAEDEDEAEVIIMEAAEDENGEETLLYVNDEALLGELFDKFQSELDEDGGGECGGQDCGECHTHRNCDCGCGE
ncbi:MAG: DUF1292 domain-containing protein [Clostridiales bacterium]|jgi:uncharacterized protein YrzB (UPF0473 family)|nr:DUF1292 domain-containing protein [Clostridiales bacterium]